MKMDLETGIGIGADRLSELELTTLLEMGVYRDKAGKLRRGDARRTLISPTEAQTLSDAIAGYKKLPDGIKTGDVYSPNERFYLALAAKDFDDSELRLHYDGVMKAIIDKLNVVVYGPDFLCSPSTPLAGLEEWHNANIARCHIVSSWLIQLYLPKNSDNAENSKTENLPVYFPNSYENLIGDSDNATEDMGSLLMNFIFDTFLSFNIRIADTERWINGAVRIVKETLQKNPPYAFKLALVADYRKSILDFIKLELGPLTEFYNKSGRPNVVQTPQIWD